MSVFLAIWRWLDLDRVDFMVITSLPVLWWGLLQESSQGVAAIVCAAVILIFALIGALRPNPPAGN